MLILKKYFCKECGFRSRLQVSKYSEFMGYYTAVTIRCKRCGNEIKQSKDILSRVCKHQIKLDMKFK